MEKKVWIPILTKTESVYTPLHYTVFPIFLCVFFSY